MSRDDVGRPPWRPHILLITLLFGALLAGLLTYLYLRHAPVMYDAAGYVAAARGVQQEGLFSAWADVDLRTYGYPFVLSLVMPVGEWLGFGPRVSAFALQWPVFVATAAAVSVSLFRSVSGRVLSFISIAYNPFLVIYTAEVLTESLTISCVLFAATTLVRAARARGASMIIWLCLGALVAAFAMEVRPANSIVPLAYLLGAVATIASRRRHGLAGRPFSVGAALLVALFLILPLVPQIAINQQVFHRVSAFPVSDLADLQAREGVAHLRYATNVSDCGGGSIRFINPNSQPGVAEPSEAIRFYLTSWPAGPQTMALHVFSGLDPRPFLTYQRDYGAIYERALQALTVAILVLAGVSLRCSWQANRFAHRDLGFRVALTFLGVVSLGATAILAMSAAEYRFGILPLMSLSLLAAAALKNDRQYLADHRRKLALGYVLGFAGWVVLSNLLLATSDSWQICSQA